MPIAIQRFRVDGWFITKFLAIAGILFFFHSPQVFSDDSSGRQTAAGTAWVDALRSSNVDERRLAINVLRNSVENLRKPLNQSDLDILLSAAGDPDVIVRQQATELLGFSPVFHERIESRLLRSLNDSVAEVRLSAIEAIARCSNVHHNSIGKLIQQGLKNSDFAIQLRTARLTETLQPDETNWIPELCELAGNPHADLRQAAIRSLGKRSQIDNHIIDAMKAAIHDTNVDVALAAVEAIGRWGEAGKPMSGPLTRLLKQPDLNTELQFQTAMSLFQLETRTAETLPALQRLMGIADHNKRTRVVDHLTELGPLALPVIWAAAHSSQTQERLSAIQTLVAIDPAVEPELVKEMLLEFSQSAESFMRGYACYGLSRYPADQAMINTCLRELRDPVIQNRHQSLRTLLVFGDRSVSGKPAIIECLKTPELQISACQLLSKFGSRAAPEAIPPLIELVRNGDHGVSQAALETLACMGAAARPAVPVIEIAQKSTDPFVRAAAVKTFWRVTGDRDKTIAAFSTLLKQQHQKVHIPATVALAIAELRISDPRLNQILLQIGKNPDSISQLISAEAIWRTAADSRPFEKVVRNTPPGEDQGELRNVFQSLGRIGPLAAPMQSLISSRLAGLAPELQKMGIGSLHKMGPPSDETLATLDSMAFSDRPVEQEVRLAAAKLMATRDAGRALLAKALWNPDAKLRLIALQGIRSASPLAASEIEAVMPLLVDSSDRIACEALLFLCERHIPENQWKSSGELTAEDSVKMQRARLYCAVSSQDPASIEPLSKAEFLSANDPITRAWAMRLISDESTLRTQLKSLSDETGFVRFWLVETVRRLAPQQEEFSHVLLEASESHAVTDARYAHALAAIGPAVIPQLVRDFPKKSPPTRSQIIAAIRLMGPRAVDPLMESLDSSDSRVRIAAIALLGTLRRQAASSLPLLRKLLQTPEINVQLTAAKAIWTIAHDARDILPVYLKVLESGTTAERIWILDALSEIGASAVTVPALTKVLQDEDPNVRIATVRLLSRMGVPASSTLPLLTQMYPSANVPLKIEILRALTAFGRHSSAALPALLPHFENADGPVLAGIYHLFASIGPSASQGFSLTQKGLTHADPEIQKSAANALVHFGPGVIPQLIRISKETPHGDADVQPFLTEIHRHWARWGVVNEVIEVEEQGLLISAHGDGALQIWNRSPQELRTLLFHPNSAPTGINRGLISKSGVLTATNHVQDHLFITAHYDGILQCWNVASQAQVWSKKVCENPLIKAIWMHEGREALTVDQDGVLRIHEVQTGNTIREIPTGLPVSAMDLSPDEKTIAIGTKAGEVQIWDLETGTLLKLLAQETVSIIDVQFGRAGKSLAVARLGQLTLWETAHWQIDRILNRYEAGPFAIAFDSSGERLCALYAQASFLTFVGIEGEAWQRCSVQRETGQSMGDVPTHLSFSRDGSTIFIGNLYGEILQIPSNHFFHATSDDQLRRLIDTGSTTVEAVPAAKSNKPSPESVQDQPDEPQPLHSAIHELKTVIEKQDQILLEPDLEILFNVEMGQTVEFHADIKFPPLTDESSRLESHIGFWVPEMVPQSVSVRLASSRETGEVSSKIAIVTTFIGDREQPDQVIREYPIHGPLPDGNWTFRFSTGLIEVIHEEKLLLAAEASQYYSSVLGIHLKHQGVTVPLEEMSVKALDRHPPLTDEQKEHYEHSQQLFARIQKLITDENDREAISAIDQLLALIPQFETRPSKRYAINLINKSLSFTKLKEYAAAADTAQLAIEEVDASIGENHPLAATALNALGEAKRNLGIYAEAKSIHEKALIIRSRLLGPGHFLTAVTLDNLGLTEQQSGNPRRAKELHQQAYQIFLHERGEDDPDTVICRSNLAASLRLLGEESAAQALLTTPSKSAPGSAPKSVVARESLLTELGELARQQGKTEEALGYFRQALAISQRTNGLHHVVTAKCLVALGTLLLETGDTIDARQELELALGILREKLPPEHPDLSAALLGMGEVLFRQGEKALARSCLQEAFEIRKKTFGINHVETSLAVGKLIACLQDQDDWVSVQKLLAIVLPEWEKILVENQQESTTQIRFLRFIAMQLINIGEPARAEEFLHRSLEMSQRVLGERHVESGRNQQILGICQERLGDDIRARRTLETALSIFKTAEGNLISDQTQTLQMLGSILLALGDSVQAERLIREALELTSGTSGRMTPVAALLCNELGFALQRQGKTEQALEAYENALEISLAVNGPDHHLTAICWNNIGSIHALKGNDQAAESCFKTVVEVFEKTVGPDQPLLANPLTQLGTLAMRRRDLPTARSHFEQALRIRLHTLGELHPQTAEARQNLGMCLTLSGDADGALSQFQQAMAAQSRIISDVLPYLSEAEALSRIQQMPGDLSLLLSAMSSRKETDSLQAFRATAEHRAAVLRLLSRRYSQPQGNAQIQQAVGELASIRRELAQLAMSIPVQAAVETRSSRLAALTRSKEAAERKLAELTTPEDSSQAESAPEDLLHIAGSLPENIAVLMLQRRLQFNLDGNSPATFQVESVYDAFLLRKQAGAQEPLVMWIDLNDAQKIDSAILKMRDQVIRQTAVTAGEDDRKYLRAAIWEKIEPFLSGCNHVVIIPDGATSILPWGALPGAQPGTFLIEDYALSTATHLQQLADLHHQQQHDDSENDVLAIGGVAYSDMPTAETPPAPYKNVKQLLTQRSGWNYLPGTLKEAEAIAALWPGRSRLLSGNAADESTVEKLLPSARYVHLATHGFFSAPAPSGHVSSSVSLVNLEKQVEEDKSDILFQRNPLLRCGLVLTGANRPLENPDSVFDGFLTAEEVVALDMSRTELVVLSACETGLGTIAGEGEGVIGLQRAFHLARAKTVVASLWKVDDHATQMLMVRFYRNLKEKKMGKLAALREAQLWLLRQTSDLRPDGSRGVIRIVDEEISQTNGRLSPYYWAAFTLSGHWE